MIYTSNGPRRRREKRGQLLLLFSLDVNGSITNKNPGDSLYCIIITTTTPVVSERNICPINGQTTDTYSIAGYSSTTIYINTLSRKLFDTLLSTPLTKG